MTDCSAHVDTLAESNVERRTILAFQADEAAVKKHLPEHWESTPFASGPSQSANLLIILTDRLFIHESPRQSVEKTTANILAVTALPAQNRQTGDKGVVIAFGLSASREGAPGPYGVFFPAKANLKSRLLAEPNHTRYCKEQWRFKSSIGDRFALFLEYESRLPVRSYPELRAYSGYDPAFYRTYRADQGTDVIRSKLLSEDRVKEFKCTADGPTLGPLLEGAADPVSVTAIPWTVRSACLPPHVALLHLQSLHPATYATEYILEQPTLWLNTPLAPTSNGVINAGESVWLDKPLPAHAVGMCRAKLADGQLRYIADTTYLSLKGLGP